jgi:hypothetical protein
MSIQRGLGLMWLATTTGSAAPDPASARAIAAFLLGQGWTVLISGMFFAVGSACFAWLLLRGCAIPVVLAWIGLVASVLLVVTLPLQLTGVLRGALSGWLQWMPMLVFEVGFALWVFARGVAPPRTRPAAGPEPVSAG